MPNVAIADSGSAAASLLNGLNAAANQEAARQATKKEQDAATYQRGQQQDLSNQLDLIKNNFVPAQTYAGGYDPPPSRPTLMTPEDNPAAQGDGPTITDRNGQVWKQKSKDQLASEDPRNFIPTGQLANMLKAGGRDVTKPISPTDAHDILQSLNLAQPKDEDYDIDMSGKFQDAQGKPAPVMVGRKTGRVRLLDFGGTNLGDPGASGQFAPPEKTPPAAKRLELKESTNDKGDVVTRGFDPETGELKSTNVAKGIGGTRKDPNAPKQEKMTAATARLIVKTKADAIAKANDNYTSAMGSAVSPELIKTAAQDRHRALQAAQNEYEESLSGATGQDVPHNDWADRPDYTDESPGRGAKPAQRTAAPAAPPAAVTKGLPAGTHTFGNGQTWKKGADGSMVYISGGN